MNARILGYVIAKDEWPLLGLAVVHVLQNGIDHLIVVDHGSSDGTCEGIECLRRAFPGQITVFRIDEQKFLQSATSQLLLAEVGIEDFDWVYVFDADEFVLSGPGTSLKTELGKLPPEVVSLRYQIDQWLTPWNFDEDDVADYVRITSRAIPRVDSEEWELLISSEIEVGNMNYFDVHFPSKIIVRAPYALRIGDGAHQLRGSEQPAEATVMPSKIRVGHLPMLSRKRLERKSRQGERFHSAGFPPQHGWQAQLLWRLESKGALDDFWLTHSEPRPEDSYGRGCPATEVDLAIQNALAEVVSEFCSIFPDPVGAHSGRTAESATSVSIGTAVNLLHDALQLGDQVAAERDQVAAERDWIAGECQRLGTYHDQVVTELGITVDSLTREIRSLRSSRAFKVGKVLVRPISLLSRPFRAG